MNEGMSGRRGPRGRSRRSRAGAAVTAVAGLALLAAACGSSAAARSSGPPTHQEMVAYAQCMRSNGVPTFPDPVVTFGGILIFPRKPSSGPAYQSARSACRKLLPEGGGFGPGAITLAQRQLALRQMLPYSVCMRAHGVAKFPDPVSTAHMIGWNYPDSLANSPQFRAAQKACQPLSRAPRGGQAP